MKVIIAIVFAIGSVSALGSGPYLPSGWRPQGPSFYLPSEVSKPSDSPLKENLVQETEASGSDALREYGPPKVDEVVQISANQGLPDVATEQTFFVQSLATQELQAGAEESVAAVEANTEQAVLLAEQVAPTTEAQLAQIAEEQVTEILSEVQPTFEATPLEVVAEVVEQTSEAVQEVATEGAVVLEENVAPTAVNAEEEVVAPTVVAQEEVTVAVEEAVVPTAAVVEQVVVERLSEGVNNIADALVKLENEVKAAEALEAAVEIKTEVSGSLQQAPEGFLEYGPPGFREYGPPKAEDLARSAAVQVAPTSAFENNEVRRRRFSPKFKTSHKKH
ncbi:hypothetical protein PYW07_010766 [Mythimna separata]|uniref:Uncharacterized protein n=1 Tax=Mythimna separata TaxID=271217 RepID=A0AAD7Y7P9_MYTSE|nr:hypothetical protein PYW07_010766 [Mythimna separata]